VEIQGLVIRQGIAFARWLTGPDNHWKNPLLLAVLLPVIPDFEDVGRSIWMTLLMLPVIPDFWFVVIAIEIFTGHSMSLICTLIGCGRFVVGGDGIAAERSANLLLCLPLLWSAVPQIIAVGSISLGCC
jgi:hypothetical protein